MEVALDDLLAVARRRANGVARPPVPITPSQLVAFQLGWQRIPGGVGTGPGAVFAAVAGFEGSVVPAAVVESDLLAGRVAGYEPRWLDDLCTSGELTWVGAGVGRIMLARRDVAGALLAALGLTGEPDPALDGPPHVTIRGALEREGSLFFRDLAGVHHTDEEVLAALWDLVWAGEVICDGFAPLRAAVAGGRLSSSRGAPSSSRPLGSSGWPGASGLPGARLRARPRPGSLRAGGPPAGQGRWSLLSRLVPRAGASPRPALALADSLLQRYGVVTRDAVRAEGLPGGLATVLAGLEALVAGGLAVEGVFVAGAGEPQFALPEALRLLDAAWRIEWRETSNRFGLTRHSTRSGAGEGLPAGAAPAPMSSAPAPMSAAPAPMSSAPASWGTPPAAAGSSGASIVSAVDPASAYGATAPWPVDGPSRVAGSHIVFLDGAGSLYVEKEGRGLRSLRSFDGTWEGAAVEALVQAVRAGRWRRLAFATYPEEMASRLIDAGFVPTPKGLVLYG